MRNRLRPLYAALIVICLPGLSPAADSLALQWEPAVEVARGAGVRGPWQQNESNYDFVDDPTVMLDAVGRSAVAWVDQARKDVLFQRYGADGKPQLAQPVNVSRSADTLSWLPRLASGPEAPEVLHLLWQEIIFSGGSHGGEMMYARSEDGGRSFSAPQNLSRSVGGDGKGRINLKVWHNGSFDILAAPGGRLHVAWTEYDGALWLSGSSDGGRSFTPPRRLDTGSPHPARAPSLAIGLDGALHLAWTVGDDEGADIHLATSTDNGRSFTPAGRLFASSGYSDAPKLAVDAKGTIHLTYAESDGGPFGRFHVRHARSTDGGRNFSQPQTVVQPTAGAHSVAYPSIATDGSNRVHVLAELQPQANERPRGLLLASSGDGGRSFGPGKLVPGSADPEGGSNGSSQGLLMKKLAVNSAGELAVVNSSLRLGSRSRVWLTRGKLSTPGRP